MAEHIVMPKLGFDMREAVLLNWLKKEGDEVKKGDIVAEIESDKATLELESQVSGTLLKFLVNAGDVAAIGANLAVVGQPGEEVPADGDKSAAPAAGSKPAEAKTADTKVEAPAKTDRDEAGARPAPAQTSGQPAADAKPAETPAAQPAPEATPAVTGEYPGGVKATPVARRVAQERQVDLKQVSGSGPDGRIRRADVEAFLQSGPKAAPAQAVAAAPVPAGPDSTEIATTRLRQAIARRMVESKTTVPHFYVTNEIDMAPAVALRQQINAFLPEEKKVSINDMIVKAAALALREFPNLNASFAGDKIVRHNRINVGSAVAVENGLLTVVQKDTDKSPLAQIAADNKAMIGRARSGKINPNDVTDGTFTVSNLGPFDVENFIAIVNPPEAAILAVGSSRQVPVVVDGQLAVGTRMKVTISADHRVTDGAEAARFMQAFKKMLEEPMRLLL
jgi:pyruvate dehydrogenase E2 component (dihydrolipoamide acetyltransferase)